jgi:hypothetical protein
VNALDTMLWIILVCDADGRAKHEKSCANHGMEWDWSKYGTLQEAIQEYDGGNPWL